MANLRYEIKTSENQERYLVAAKDIRAGETIFSEEPFVLGPDIESGLLCFNCYRPVISKFVVCKNCAVAPICPDDGCPALLTKFHTKTECDKFREWKLSKELHPMTMVANVGSLTALRALMKKDYDPPKWEEFMALETHLEERRDTPLWHFAGNTEKFIKSLDLLNDNTDKDIIQKICAIIDVNSFEVRGPTMPGIGVSEFLRGVYLKAALLTHHCTANTHISINDNNLLVCHANTEIKKGDTIYFNFTDPLKGTAVRQELLQVGKYVTCSCPRCGDATESGTHLSSALCPTCKTGYATQGDKGWTCNSCSNLLPSDIIDYKLQCCSDKLDHINKKDEKDLEEYIRNVSLVLAPNHYLLLDAKQRLAGVLRDTINREPRPTKKLLKRKIELCEEILPVIEKLSPGICRTKAITLYELHATMVQLAKKMFDAREISGSAYMDELNAAEKHLKRALEMLLIEPGNSPEGELCAKALEEYRELKNTMNSVLDGLHAEGKAYVTEITDETAVSLVK